MRIRPLMLAALNSLALINFQKKYGVIQKKLFHKSGEKMQ